jgi:hypothetical protein
MSTPKLGREPQHNKPPHPSVLADEISASAEVDSVDAVGSEPGSHIRATVACVAIVREGLNRKLRLVCFRVYRKQLFGVIHWEAAEHNGVDCGEDGRVRADAESEGHDRGNRESQARTKPPDGDAEILLETIHIGMERVLAWECSGSFTANL